MAITGHTTLEEVERYTRAAQRAELTDSAMALLPAREERALTLLCQVYSNM